MVAILLSAVSGQRDCLLKLSNHLMSFDDMKELKRISRILLKNLSTQWNLKWAKNVNNIELKGFNSARFKQFIHFKIRQVRVKGKLFLAKLQLSAVRVSVE